MGFSFWHIVIVVLVILVLFGTGRLPRLMEDLGKGINSFKKGLKEEDPSAEKTKAVEDQNKE
jgi:sec-independent protein translocase protein TatA